MSKKKDKRLTRAAFVTSLIDEIHEKMKAGFKLDEICDELNKTLPEDEQMKKNTFRTYVRNAREEVGIKPLRSWTRRIDAEAEDIPKRILKDTQKDNTKAKTESNFRDMDGDL